MERNAKNGCPECVRDSRRVSLLLRRYSAVPYDAGTNGAASR